jgi:uncharacterized protein (TIGR00297 family)
MPPPRNRSATRPLLTTRKVVHISMLGFALLLPFLTWEQAAGAAILALLFNLYVLPRLGADLRKRPGNASLHIAAQAAGVREAGTWTGIIIYPISVLLLILFYRHALYVVAAVWAIMALGDGLASVAGEAFDGPRLPFNAEKTWSGFAAFMVAGTAGAYLLARWAVPPPDPSTGTFPPPPLAILLVCAATALVGALVESAPARLDDNLSVPLVSGAFMYCAFLMQRSSFESNLPYLGRRFLVALAVNLALALLALALGMVDRSGAAAGFLLGVSVYLGFGWRSFLPMLAFFASGSLATRLGYSQKSARGVAQRHGGARTWREALANTLPSAFFSLLVITTAHQGAFLMALTAAFAEAAGDTVSSEIGQWLSQRAYLITTLRPVAAGTNGGVSLVGSAAGCLASALIVGLCYWVGLVRPAGAVVCFVAALAGNLLDSVLGGTIERQKLITNDMVNFAGTSFAGALATAVAFHWGM